MDGWVGDKMNAKLSVCRVVSVIWNYNCVFSLSSLSCLDNIKLYYTLNLREPICYTHSLIHKIWKGHKKWGWSSEGDRIVAASQKGWFCNFALYFRHCVLDFLEHVENEICVLNICEFWAHLVQFQSWHAMNERASWWVDHTPNCPLVPSFQVTFSRYLYTCSCPPS